MCWSSGVDRSKSWHVTWLTSFDALVTMSERSKQDAPCRLHLFVGVVNEGAALSSCFVDNELKSTFHCSAALSIRHV